MSKQNQALSVNLDTEYPDFYQLYIKKKQNILIQTDGLSCSHPIFTSLPGFSVNKGKWRKTTDERRGKVIPGPRDDLKPLPEILIPHQV